MPWIYIYVYILAIMRIGIWIFIRGATFVAATLTKLITSRDPNVAVWSCGDVEIRTCGFYTFLRLCQHFNDSNSNIPRISAAADCDHDTWALSAGHPLFLRVSRILKFAPDKLAHLIFTPLLPWLLLLHICVLSFYVASCFQWEKFSVVLGKGSNEGGDSKQELRRRSFERGASWEVHKIFLLQ